MREGGRIVRCESARGWAGISSGSAFLGLSEIRVLFLEIPLKTPWDVVVLSVFFSVWCTVLTQSRVSFALLTGLAIPARTSHTSLCVLLQLCAEGMAREVPVFGILGGLWVTGVIDEMRCA